MSAQTQTFTLGQTVQFTGTIEKGHDREPFRTVYRPAPLPRTGADFRPKPETHPGMWDRRHTSHGTGIIVGKRTIADYHRECEGYDEMPYAVVVPGTHRTAWLVAWNLHRKPVMVLTEQIVEAAPVTGETITVPVTIPAPHVPHGPLGVPEHVADAHYFAEAADHIEGGYKVGGSNLTAAVIKLLRDVSAALKEGPTS